MVNMKECYNCKKSLEDVGVVVISECEQYASIDKDGNIYDFGTVENVYETKTVECRNCGHTVTGWQQ
jgi:DNA-directed RNA polymerase subunit RPC12/RpoP